MNYLRVEVCYGMDIQQLQQLHQGRGDHRGHLVQGFHIDPIPSHTAFHSRSLLLCVQPQLPTFSLLCPAPTVYIKKERKKERTKDDSKTTPTLPPAWIIVLLHLWVGLTQYIILKWASRGLEGPKDYCLLLKVKTFNRRRQASLHLSLPKGEPRRFPHGWLKIYSSPGCPHYRSGPWVVGCTRSQVLGRSPIRALFQP